MNFFLNILKWILIILFFPLSLLFVAYFKQRKSNNNYWKDKEGRFPLRCKHLIQNILHYETTNPLLSIDFSNNIMGTYGADK